MIHRVIVSLNASGILRVMDNILGEGLRAKAIKGSGWTLIGFGAQQVLRLISNLILTRLLYPEAFGYMSLAAVYLTGLQMFSDLGIRPAIIQNKRGEQIEFLNTAWTMQVIRGFVLWIVACILAFPVSRLYETDVLFPLLCASGSIAAIRGFQTTAYATKNKKLEIGVITCIELGSKLLGIIAMISWALISPTVWALAVGGVVSALASVIVAHILINTHRHRLCWDRDSVRELIGFGKWIFISSILTFIASSGDRFMLPVLLDFQELAYFSLALGLVMIPIRILKRMSSTVLFPVYSQIYNTSSAERLSNAVRRYTRVSLIVYIYPLFLLLGGQWLIELMYDDRYLPAGAALTVLSVGCLFAMLRASQSGILLAVGKPKRAMYINLVKISCYFVIGYALAKRWGLEGFCAGYAASEGAAYAVQSQLIQAVLPKEIFKYERSVLLVMLAAMGLLIVIVLNSHVVV